MQFTNARSALSNSITTWTTEANRVLTGLINQVETSRGTAIKAAQYANDNNLVQSIDSTLSSALNTTRYRLSAMITGTFDNGYSLVQTATNEVVKKINGAPLSAKLDVCWDSNKDSMKVSIDALLTDFNGTITNESKPVLALAEQARKEAETANSDVAAGQKTCQALWFGQNGCTGTFVSLGYHLKIFLIMFFYLIYNFFLQLKGYIVANGPRLDTLGKNLDSAYNTMKTNLQGKALDILGKISSKIQEFSNSIDTCLAT